MSRISVALTKDTKYKSIVLNNPKIEYGSLKPVKDIWQFRQTAQGLIKTV